MLFLPLCQRKNIVGIVRVASEYRLDPTDDKGTFGLVDMETIISLKNPISLSTIKEQPLLSNMALLKNSRLSVQPVTPLEWDTIMKLSKTNLPI